MILLKKTKNKCSNLFGITNRDGRTGAIGEEVWLLPMGWDDWVVGVVSIGWSLLRLRGRAGVVLTADSSVLD